MMERPPVVFSRNRNERVVPRAFFPLPFCNIGPIRLSTKRVFHELFYLLTRPPSKINMTSLSPIGLTFRGWRLVPFTPLTRKRGSFAALGFGRWALAHHHGTVTRTLPDKGVCACVFAWCMRLCVYVYINLHYKLFGFCGPRPARGDRSDPATLRELMCVRERERERKGLLPKSVIVYHPEQDYDFVRGKYACEQICTL